MNVLPKYFTLAIVNFDTILNAPGLVDPDFSIKTKSSTCIEGGRLVFGGLCLKWSFLDPRPRPLGGPKITSKS